MVQTLLRKKLLKTLHIAITIFLILFVQSSSAQTVLIPGDIVFVSVNSPQNSFEFVPLIPLDKGTEIRFGIGKWDSTSGKLQNPNELVFQFDSEVEPGTVFRYSIIDEMPGVTVQGNLDIKAEGQVLYAFQKEGEVFRFLYGIQWGDFEKRKDRRVEIPLALSEVENGFLKLGTEKSYQYYIRNGASGTRNMLLNFISNPAFWKGKSGRDYFGMGTSFNLLKPPVILFDESISSVNENQKTTLLNVAIYEHDGSKLTVDIVYDSLYSTLDNSELSDFSYRSINFTGLIGDAVFGIEVEIKNDNQYEGTETGIFELQNLSKGSFGDFISHTMLVRDDEIPLVHLDLVSTENDQFLVIHNLENKRINLSNWILRKGKSIFEIAGGTYLEPASSISIFESKSSLFALESGAKISLNASDDGFLTKSGQIELINKNGNSIEKLRIKQIRKTDSDSRVLNNTGITEVTFPVNEIESVSGQVPEQSRVGIPGWKYVKLSEVPEDIKEKVNLFTWNNEKKVFVIDEVSLSTDFSIEQYALGYFDSEQVLSLEESKEFKARAFEEDDQLLLNLSAVDINTNSILDGIEGLNFGFNSTSKSISIDWLQAQVTEQIKVANHFDVHVWNLEQNEFRLLKENERINPGRWFTVVMKEFMVESTVTLNINEQPEPEGEITGVEPIGHFSLQVSEKGATKNLQFDFYDTDKELTSYPSVNQYDALKISGLPFNTFTLQNGNNHYSGLELPEEPDRGIHNFDITFLSSQSGLYTLSVQDWENIPGDWIIVVKDRLEERSYILDENWEIEFEYVSMFSNEVEAEFVPFGFKKDFEPVKRFELHLMSKQKYYEEENIEQPQKLDLHQNYPNPFNPVTTISFFLPEESEVKLSVFNIVGQPVATLIEGGLSSGEHTIDWDASEMPSGMYIYQLEVGTRIMTRKMTLIK